MVCEKLKTLITTWYLILYFLLYYVSIRSLTIILIHAIILRISKDAGYCNNQELHSPRLTFYLLGCKLFSLLYTATIFYHGRLNIKLVIVEWRRIKERNQIKEQLLQDLIKKLIKEVIRHDELTKYVMFYTNVHFSQSIVCNFIKCLILSIKYEKKLHSK